MKYLLLFLFSTLTIFFPVSAINRGFGLKDPNPSSSATIDFQGWVKHIQLKGLDIDPKHQEGKLIDVIKGLLNRILGILGLIALLVLLRGGFQMLTAVGDEKKYGAGRTHLKSAAIALLYIGIAWFIVSMIFYLLHLATT